MDQATLSIVIPCKNEARSLETLLPRIRAAHNDAELIVVDDGSTDDTVAVSRKHGANVVSLPYNMGNGAAIKNGARRATGDILVFMDADGQHSPDDISRLLEELNKGFDMVVGARSAGSQASVGRMIANSFYNRLASWIVNSRIADLTSGFRAVRADLFREFLHLLPNGFSYPTTITMAFFRAGYAVGYAPIVAQTREGKSHIRILRDGIRFLIIIFKIGTLYSPLKIFFPLSIAHFLLGLSYYAYTYMAYGRFTNMTALLFVASMLIFLIGLVSEQITALLFSRTSNSRGNQ